MEYTTERISAPAYTSRAFRLYFGNMKTGILDIETTGLSPKNSKFILGGLLTPEGDQLLVQQFFAEDFSQEKDTLDAFVQAVSELDVLITYNGKHFDIPFIKGRRQDTKEILPYNLDLYLLVKDHSPIRKFLPNLKQKTVENYMGLWQTRKDEISGRESVDLYYRYLSQKDPAVKDTILLHNHDDVVQLHRLLRVLEKSDFHKAMHHMGFPVSAAGIYLIIETISLSRDHLTVSGIQQRNPVGFRCFQWDDIPCSACFDSEHRTFSVSVPLIRHSGLVLADLKALKLSDPQLRKYPACQEDFMILERHGNLHYMEINHFTKSFLERMLNQWITKKPQQM